MNAEATLIELVEKFPQLWDKRYDKYDDKICVENAWQTIANIMELQEDECQSLWKSIRTKYIRERRIIKNLPSGSGSYSSKWPLYNHCGFLDKVIVTRKTKGNILSRRHSTDQPSELWNETIIVEEHEQENTDEPEESQVSSNVSTNVSDVEESSRPSSQNSTVIESQKLGNTKCIRPLTTPPKYKKIKKGDIPVDELLNTCNTIGQNLTSLLKHECGSDPRSDQSSEDYYFAMSLVRSLNKIKSDSKKMLLKAQILTLISKEIEN